MDMLNPFELLGVSENSTMNELKTAYYRLALICHPDKGGEPEAMKTLVAAYRWVLSQLEHRDAHSKTFSEEFGTPENRPSVPSFTDVLAESFGHTMERFREKCLTFLVFSEDIHKMLFIPAFEWAIQQGATPETFETKLDIYLQRYLDDQAAAVGRNGEFYIPMSDPRGYGEYMERSQQNDELNTVDFEAPMVVYQEPQDASLVQAQQHTIACLNPNEPTNGFTLPPLYDYQEAFQIRKLDPESSNSATVDSMTLQEWEAALEEKQLERAFALNATL
jgi:hypothetical protein